MHRVTDGLERKRVLRQAGNQVQPRPVADRDDQMLIVDVEIARERRAGKGLRGGIDRRDPTHDEPSAHKHFANRRHDLLRKN